MTKGFIIKQLLTSITLAFSLSLSSYAIACELALGYELSEGVSWGELCDFNEGLASAQKYGFIVKQANIIVPFSYDFTAEFSEGLAIVKKDEHHGYINKKNQVIIPIIYDDVRPFSESKAAVEHEGKWGVINDTGELTIPYQFDEIRYFSEGLAPVRKDELWGYIDSSGKTVVLLNYLNADSFHNGLAVVAKENGYGMINKDNKIIVPTEYDMPIFIGNYYIDTFKFVKGNNFYYFDSNGDRLAVSSYLDTIPEVILDRQISIQ